MVIFHSQVKARISKERQKKGKHGEARALAYLEREGCALVQKNYRTRFGEIDLIMQQGNTLVFVEVRYRSKMDFGGAAASITPIKKRRMVSAAEQFLMSYSSPPPCRFDVIALDGERITWLKNVIQF